MAHPQSTSSQQQENPFWSILFNIIIPPVILNQLADVLGGPTIALLVALAFPLGYGLMDYVQRQHKNYISLLGLVNVLFTGGLALMQLKGIWFAVKEAAFPFLIGIGVYLSAFSRRPFVEIMICNENVLKMNKIRERLQQYGQEQAFRRHLKHSTYLFALSFFLSAALNFILAQAIFTKIDPSLSSAETSTVLNEQIAQMTWLSFVVIVFPLMIFTMFILWHLIKGIKHMTGLELEDILPQGQ